MSAGQATAADPGLLVAWSCAQGSWSTFSGKIRLPEPQVDGEKDSGSINLRSIEHLIDRRASGMPDHHPAELRRELAQWELVMTSLKLLDPDADNAIPLLYWGLPVATTDPAAAMVRSALRLEAELINSFSLPDWFAPHQKRMVARLTLPFLILNHDEVVLRIRRLATDSVWEQFRRRGIYGGEKRYIYRLHTAPTPDEVVNQEYAVALLLHGAVEIYVSGIRTIRPDQLMELQEIVATIREWQATLSAFRTDHHLPAIELSLVNLYIDRLASLVKRCDRNLEEYELFPELIVSRLPPDPQVQAFLIELLYATRGLFGTPLYGCVRRIASAMFDKTIYTSLVRRCAEKGAGASVSGDVMDRR